MCRGRLHWRPEPTLPTASALERNLRLYPWLHVGRNALFWLPVFVLYFSSLLSPAEVLRLEAVYYAAAVLLEVPSGYFSDRVGRRWTLLIASVAWVAGSAVLAASSSFEGLAMGQILLAAGMAFQSGTDSSLLYDSLTALNRGSELARREARAQSLGYATLAVSALAGGAVGSLDLRLGHALTAVVGLVAVWATWLMVEPPRADAPNGPIAQLRMVAQQVTNPVLRWTLAFAVGMTVAVHIPYELAQPWLDTLIAPLDTGALAATPPVSGAAMCVMMGLAAWFGPRGPALAKRIGPTGALLVSWALLVGVLGAMAIGVHPALLPFLALRSVPSALSGPVLASMVHPQLPSSVRATWLSIQSLIGRLAFAATLTLAAATLSDHDGWTFDAMRGLLVPAVAGAAGWAVILWLTKPRDPR